MTALSYNEVKYTVVEILVLAALFHNFIFNFAA